MLPSQVVLYSRNYYSWTHRLWLLNLFPPESRLRPLQIELQTNQKWTDRNISDNSALSHRRAVLTLLSQTDLTGFFSPQGAPDGPEERVARLWQSEETYIHSQLRRFPKHHSLWYHLRFVVTQLLLAPHPADPAHPAHPHATGGSEGQSTADRLLARLQHALSFVAEILTGLNTEEVSGGEGSENNRVDLKYAYTAAEQSVARNGALACAIWFLSVAGSEKQRQESKDEQKQGIGRLQLFQTQEPSCADASEGVSGGIALSTECVRLETGSWEAVAGLRIRLLEQLHHRWPTRSTFWTDLALPLSVVQGLNTVGPERQRENRVREKTETKTKADIETNI